MILKSTDNFLELKKIISRIKRTSNEILLLDEKLEKSDKDDKQIINSQINSLKLSLRNNSKELDSFVKSLELVQPVKKFAEKKIVIKEEPKPILKEEKVSKKKGFFSIFGFSNSKKFSRLEKKSIKRVWKKEKVIVKKEEEKPSAYIKTANRMFSETSENLAKKEFFREMKRNLTKSNLQLVPKTYISISLFTIFLSSFLGIFITLFFLFFNITAQFPIIHLMAEPFGLRFLKVFWILFMVPVLTAMIMYYYPSLEKKSNENKINAELPFATIHMSSISGSMIDPTKIFSIIISTNEYPTISKEFTKLLNQINLYGNDLVSSLRELSFNTASSKLSELLNGLSTTINSGGDLANFFEKRAESLLFEYKIEREKQTKTAETFMDIYISIVIAAPMIFMLLLMMMKISGLGISLSSSMISLVMVLGVTMINIGFLVFLQLKQPAK